MKKLLLSILTISLMTTLAYGATSGFFSDTEVSKGNTFSAGSIDLEIDNTSYLNGIHNSATSWGLTDLSNEVFFNFKDLKPGDWGEDTVSIHVKENNAWACVTFDNLVSTENTRTDPEKEDGDTPGDNGELDQALNFIFWVDDEDNVLEDDEVNKIIAQGPASAIVDNATFAIADSDENNVGGQIGDPLSTKKTYFIGKAWCLGTLTPDPVAQGANSPTVDPGIDCNGGGANNLSQTDSLTGDITFYAEQWRNNPNFQCGT